MNWNTRIRLGIPAPEAAEDISEQPSSVDAMRRAIEKASHDSGFILRALHSARIQGFSGEDTYVLLAYHALRLLEDAHQREQHYLQKLPMPWTRIKKEGEAGV